MKECTKCKAIMDDDALFCGVCGTKLEIKEVQGENPYEAKLCIHCGGELVENGSFCPHCGKTQEIEAVKDEPQQKPVKEPGQTKSQGAIPSSKPEQPEEEELPTYVYEEEKKSKTWLWILLTLFFAGGFGVWYYLNDGLAYRSTAHQIEAEDTVSVEEPDESNSYNDEMLLSPLAFLEDFYKGNHLSEDSIMKFVTANVLNKLKRDYEYDGCEECLATWVFTAYPTGADMELEEGPIFSPTDRRDRFKIDFKYSFNIGEKKRYETRTVYLTVSEMDGKYLISDYEVRVDNNLPAESKEESLENESNIQLHGFVDELPITMSLIIDGAVVKGYYYYDKQGPDKLLNLSGVYKDGEMDIYESDEEGRQTGHFRGWYINKVFHGEFINQQGIKLSFRVSE